MPRAKRFQVRRMPEQTGTLELRITEEMRKPGTLRFESGRRGWTPMLQIEVCMFVVSSCFSASSRAVAVWLVHIWAEMTQACTDRSAPPRHVGAKAASHQRVQQVGTISQQHDGLEFLGARWRQLSSPRCQGHGKNQHAEPKCHQDRSVCRHRNDRTNTRRTTIDTVPTMFISTCPHQPCVSVNKLSATIICTATMNTFSHEMKHHVSKGGNMGATPQGTVSERNQSLPPALNNQLGSIALLHVRPHLRHPMGREITTITNVWAIFLHLRADIYTLSSITCGRT